MKHLRRPDPLAILIVLVVISVFSSAVNLWIVQRERSVRISETNALICDLGTATREQTEAFRAIALRVPPGAFRTDLERAITAGWRLERELGDTCSD